MTTVEVKILQDQDPKKHHQQKKKKLSKARDRQRERSKRESSRKRKQKTKSTIKKNIFYKFEMDTSHVYSHGRSLREALVADMTLEWFDVTRAPP